MLLSNAIYTTIECYLYYYLMLFILLSNVIYTTIYNVIYTTIYCYISCFQETYCGNAELLRLLATFRSKSIDRENVREKKAKIIGESKDNFQPISEDPTMTY